MKRLLNKAAITAIATLGAAATSYADLGFVFVSGDFEVSADGSEINFVSGGYRNADGEDIELDGLTNYISFSILEPFISVASSVETDQGFSGIEVGLQVDPDANTSTITVGANVDGSADAGFDIIFNLPEEAAFSVEESGNSFSLTFEGASSPNGGTISPDPDGNLDGIASAGEYRLAFGAGFNNGTLVYSITFDRAMDIIPDSAPAWAPVGEGLNNWGYAMTEFDDGTGAALYVGGNFTAAGGGSASRIARWNGDDWSPLGAGVVGAVNSLELFDDGAGTALYAAGTFTQAGGTPAGLIARWNDGAWSPLAGGLSSGGVSFLEVFNDGSGDALYAGGWFTQADGNSANRIARWDGDAWSTLGSGLNSTVRGMTVFNDGGGDALYVGGDFSLAGGGAANRIARWDGNTWSPVGSGMNDRVYALTVFNGELYAGGRFTTAGGVSANRIARWDGSGWTALGDGVNDIVRSLTVIDDGNGPALYAGGDFTEAGGQPANYIARWDGASWSSLGQGVNQRVYSLAGFDDGSGPTLHVGGEFTEAGGNSADYIARWGVPGESTPCPGDASGDGEVDLADLNLVLANFGQSTSEGDTNGDGVVDLADLNTVLGAFGSSC